MPTLPTPTTLRAACTNRNSSSGWCSTPSVRRYDESISLIRASDCSHSDPGSTRSSSGTISGGSAMNRSWSWTLPTRRVNTRTLSRVRALATCSFADRCSCLLSSTLRNLLFHHLEEVARLQMVVPDLEGSRSSSLTHALPVFPSPRHDDVPAIGAGEAAAPSHDLKTGGQALQVPLPRTRERLVEVVDVEDELAFGRAEQAKVQQMRITAELHGDVRSGSCRQVGGHDQCRPSIEGEGRDQHPSIADRNQLGHSGGALFIQERDGVRPICVQLGSGRGWNGEPGGAPPCPRATRSSTVRRRLLHDDANERSAVSSSA